MAIVHELPDGSIVRTFLAPGASEAAEAAKVLAVLPAGSARRGGDVTTWPDDRWRNAWRWNPATSQVAIGPAQARALKQDEIDMEVDEVLAEIDAEIATEQAAGRPIDALRAERVAARAVRGDPTASGVAGLGVAALDAQVPSALAGRRTRIRRRLRRIGA